MVREEDFKTIEVTNTDSKGRIYHHIAIPCIKEGVLSLGESNMVYEGWFKVVLRNGESKFGEQVIFEFRIDKLKETYPCKSKHDCFEVYMPKKEALEVFARIINKIVEERKNGT